MSATSKRNRALLSGEEPVTGKSIHLGDEPMPEYLDVKPRLTSAEATEAPAPTEPESPPDPPEDT